jgi:hypothetical protein
MSASKPHIDRQKTKYDLIDKSKMMRKTILMLVTASALVTGMVSCKKEEMAKVAITQTISVSLKMDQAYTFVLPKNLRNNPYEITSQAAHYSLSQVGVNSAGDPILQYTPATGYVGNDQVIVSNDQERGKHKKGPKHKGPKPPKGHKPPKGDCKGEQEEDHYIITVNFNIEGITNATR